jgi:hypothetical protein
MKSARLTVVALLPFLVSACDLGRTRPAHGKVNSIIVVAVDSLWSAVEDSVRTALEPRIFTVRDEKTFEITHVSPLNEDWLELRRFKQVLAIGTAQDGWMQPVVEEHPGIGASTPDVVEQRDVWARGQLVTAAVLPPGSGAEALESAIGELADQFDFRFREYAQSRMFLSGVDSARQDSLARMAGFSLLLPEIYRAEKEDSAWVFRNHAQMGGELQRTILVTWRAGESTPDEAGMLAWRDSIAAIAYNPANRTTTDRVEVRALPADRAGETEIHGVWEGTDPGWPAAGPFVARVVPCPGQGRTYLLDAWLYAHGKAKYEYMIQLQTILDSFRCDGGRAAAAAG